MSNDIPGSPEYRDEKLCAECGGKCCLVYGPTYSFTWHRLQADRNGDTSPEGKQFNTYRIMSWTQNPIQ